jgi:hypothetical protein
MNASHAGSFAAAVLLASSCAPAPSQPQSPIAVEPSTNAVDKPETDRFIVWLRDNQDAAKSYWIEAASTGHRVSDQQDGVFIAVGDTTWMLRKEPLSVDTVDCNEPDGTAGSTPGRGSAQRLIAEQRDGAKGEVVIDPELDNAAGEFTHQAIILASVGPLVFIQERKRSRKCGAPESTDVSLFFWDLRRQGQALVVGPSPTPSMIARAEEMLADGSGQPPSFDWAAVLPRYETGGKLVADYLFISSCHDCDGVDWGSHRKHALVPGPVPEQLAPYADVPAAVRSFATEESIDLGGWSQVASTLLEAPAG